MYFSIQKNSDTAVYEQIVQAICRGIKEGQLAAGDEVETEQALAIRLEISRQTVNRAYEKLRILEVLISTRGRGSHISQNAQELLGIEKPLRPMRKIAYLVSAIGRMSQIPPYHRHQVYDVLEGITQRLEDTHTTLTHFCIGRWNKQDPMSKNQLATLRSRLEEFDGVLLHAEPKSADPVIPLILDSKLPCVRMYHPSPDRRMSHVIYDQTGAVELAVQHLINQGYRSIGYLGPDDRHEEVQYSKYAAFNQFLGEHDLTLNREHFCQAHNYDATEAVQKYLGRMAGGTPALPEAFFVANDWMALQAMAVFQAAGIDIPGDLALMSFDDISETALMRPALSTIHTPRRDIGYQAADMLLNWPLQGDAPPVQVLEAKLIERETCPKKECIAANI